MTIFNCLVNVEFYSNIFSKMNTGSDHRAAERMPEGAP